jgi:hypothetical protein
MIQMTRYPYYSVENNWDWLSNLTRIAYFHDLRVPQGGMTNCPENNIRQGTQYPQTPTARWS